MDNDNITLTTSLRDLTASILDLDAESVSNQVRPDLAEELLVVLAAQGRILLIDSSGRDIRKFASVIAGLEEEILFHHFCSPKITCADLLGSSSGRKVWFLEQIDALPLGEQALAGEIFLEENSSPTSPKILIASVSSVEEASSLCEELKEVLGGVFTLPKIGSSRLRNELLGIGVDHPMHGEITPVWTFLKQTHEKVSDDLVNNIVMLADRVATLDPTSVTERPPIDALKNQARVLSLLASFRSASGKPPLPFENLQDLHIALLAHRIRRVDSEGKSNEMIVGQAVMKFVRRAAVRPAEPGQESFEKAKDIFTRIRNYLSTLVIGRDDDGHVINSTGNSKIRGVGTIDLMLAALFSEGHILFEDYPGTGKSYMIEKLSDCIEDDIVEPGIDITSYKHIQCVPDLMPSDLTGGEIFAGDRMVFRSGPVFAYLVLIDEINRTTPKVQAALLEAMSDRKVTIGNHQYELGKVFFVLATQNPLDTVGTYPLPQAQLDRFIFKRRLEPLDDDAVVRILNLDRIVPPKLDPVRISELAEAIASVKQVPVGKNSDGKDDINPLLLEISRRFKSLCDPSQAIPQGCFRLKEGSTPSPRSLKKFLAGLKAIAFIEWAKGGSEMRVTSTHVQRLARDYFTHRITPEDEENQDPKNLGELVDLVVSESIQSLRQQVG
jgi:MoxR-like ATPase